MPLGGSRPLHQKRPSTMTPGASAIGCTADAITRKADTTSRRKTLRFRPDSRPPHRERDVRRTCRDTSGVGIHDGLARQALKNFSILALASLTR